jgi:hypothetical protein
MLYRTYLHSIFTRMKQKKRNHYNLQLHAKHTGAYPDVSLCHMYIATDLLQVVRLRRDVLSACTISVTCTGDPQSKVFIPNISARHCYYSHYRCEPCKVKHDVISVDTELWPLECKRLSTAVGSTST